MCLAQGHKAVTTVRLEPAAPRSRVKHSIPLRSHFSNIKIFYIKLHIFYEKIYRQLLKMMGEGGCVLCIYQQGTNIFQYCTCLAGPVTYNFHLSCRYMHLSFKSVCNKEHKGVICNMTSTSNSSQSTRPVGRVLWEELLFLSTFHSKLRADEWNLCPLTKKFKKFCKRKLGLLLSTLKVNCN